MKGSTPDEPNQIQRVNHVQFVRAYRTNDVWNVGNKKRGNLHVLQI